MFTSLPFTSRKNATWFGGVPEHRWGAITGWQHRHIRDGHKPVERPQGPDGTPERSAEGIQQQPAGELLENTQRSAHSARWRWGAQHIYDSLLLELLLHDLIQQYFIFSIISSVGLDTIVLLFDKWNIHRTLKRTLRIIWNFYLTCFVSHLSSSFTFSAVLKLHHTILPSEYESVLAGDDIVNVAVVIKDVMTKERVLAAQEISMSAPPITIQVGQHPASSLISSQSATNKFYNVVVFSFPSSSLLALISFMSVSCTWQDKVMILMMSKDRNSYRREVFSIDLSVCVYATLGRSYKSFGFTLIKTFHDCWLHHIRCTEFAIYNRAQSV